MIAENIENAMQYLKCSELRYSYTLLRNKESFYERSALKNKRDSFLSLIDRLRIFYFWDFDVDIGKFIRIYVAQGFSILRQVR